MTFLKSKFFYSLCKKNDKKNKDEDDGVVNTINKIDNLNQKKSINFNKEYPDELKNILSLYFQKWRGGKPLRTKFFFGKKTVSLPENMQRFVFKKDKVSEAFIQALLDNIPDKEDIDIKDWIKNPLRRMVVLRYRRERMIIFRFLLKWYSKVRLMLAIQHLDKIVEGRLKLTALLRHRPSQILYKRMKLMNPKFYKTKGEKLVKTLLNIAKLRPFKQLIDNMKLLNRINKLREIQPNIHDILSDYYLRKYFNKWRNNVNEMKEQKIQLLLTYVKKKIKDEGIISNRRKNELLRRFINNLMKDKMNKLLFAFKIWDKIAKVLKEEKKPLFREVDGGILTTINGEEKLIDGKDIREGGEINIKLLKNKDGQFTIEDIVNNTLTEKERQEIIQKKMPETIEKFDDKKKSLLQKKLYQWKNNAKKISCHENAHVIQKFLGRKFGQYLLKKRANFFANLAKNYLTNSILNAAKVNKLDNILRNIFYKRFLDNLYNKGQKISSINSLNDNILKANDNLNEQNQKIAVKKLLKIYSYVVLKKLFECITKKYKKTTKGSNERFINGYERKTT
jgi:hypothetical protein